MVVRDSSSELRAVAHDLRSSLRAIAIYSDLLSAQVRLEQLDRSRIDQLCASILAAIETHSEQLEQLEQIESTIDIPRNDATQQ